MSTKVTANGWYWLSWLGEIRFTSSGSRGAESDRTWTAFEETILCAHNAQLYNPLQLKMSCLWLLRKPMALFEARWDALGVRCIDCHECQVVDRFICWLHWCMRPFIAAYFFWYEVNFWHSHGSSGCLPPTQCNSGRNRRAYKTYWCWLSVFGKKNALKNAYQISVHVMSKW